MPLPPPSTLTLLPNLSSFPRGSKVRFLGCITDYSPETSTITLAHKTTSATLNHPPPAPNTTPTLLAKVDIFTPLPLLSPGSLINGEWVNVIGYISWDQHQKQNQPDNSDESRLEDGEEEEKRKATVYVQALHLWSAGDSIDLGGFEKAVRGRTGLGREGGRKMES